jgi:hypothetical protein
MRIVIDVMDDGSLFIGEDPDGPQLMEEDEAMEEAEGEGMMDGEAEEPEMEEEPQTEPVANERELMMRLKEMIANATAGMEDEGDKAFEAGFEEMR